VLHPGHLLASLRRHAGGGHHPVAVGASWPRAGPPCCCPATQLVRGCAPAHAAVFGASASRRTRPLPFLFHDRSSRPCRREAQHDLQPNEQDEVITVLPPNAIRPSLIVLILFYSVQIVLESCRRALHSVLMFVISYNYEFIDLKCNLISINLIVFN
jgi:hypothetical protein